MKKKAIEIFLDHFDGNQSEAGRALGKKQQHVWYWLNTEGSDMPTDLVPRAADLIGKTPHDLKPEVFRQ